ncbi:MAG TPA: helix-turn-helix domain-containing protein [Burkholderiaceae bacterium]|nr:helix-turn-helix domain-containing protein [Burkholderiaceae bacterium]
MRALLSHSTDDVDPDQRVRHWREAIHDAVIEMELLPNQRSDFFSRIDLCPMPNIVPHRAVGSPQRISRSRSEIGHGNKNTYYLISQSRVPWYCEHAGMEHLVKPGESVLVDSRIPYTFKFEQGLDDLSVELPVEWVERWLPDPRRVIGRPLPAASGWGLALRGAKEALAPSELVALPVPDELLEDQLGALLALASGAQIDVAHTDHELYDRCVAHIRQWLSRPGLVASEVAAACGVSLRTMHRTFAAEDHTFAGVLMRSRIDDAARMLADPRFRLVTVAEIGRRCGFSDPSHFARQFRRLRNTGPRQFRNSLSL